MFGFGKKNTDLLALNQKMGRFINDHFYVEMDLGSERQRTESRCKCSVPCVLFLFSEAQNPQCYATGTSVELSLHGMSLITTDHLEINEYVIVMGAADKRLYVRAKCKFSKARELGAYYVGLQLTAILNPLEYPGITKTIQSFEANQQVPCPV